MKLLLLLACLSFQGNGGVVIGAGTGTTKWNASCSKALQIADCDGCESMASIKCKAGDMFFTCQDAMWGCGDNHPQPGTNVRCPQANPGNSCGQQQE